MSETLPEAPAARHARIAQAFTDRVLGVPTAEAWDAPAPVPTWVARDVVRHLVTWFPGFLASGSGVTLPAGPPVDDDPVQAWQTQRLAVQALLEEPTSGSRVLSNPHLGEIPLPDAIDRFYTSDVFMHTWDLARATGQDETLDPGTCRQLYDGLRSMGEALYVGGQYGPPVEVPEDADVQTRMLGLIGRHP